MKGKSAYEKVTSSKKVLALNFILAVVASIVIVYILIGAYTPNWGIVFSIIIGSWIGIVGCCFSLLFLKVISKYIDTDL